VHAALVLQGLLKIGTRRAGGPGGAGTNRFVAALLLVVQALRLPPQSSVSAAAPFPSASLNNDGLWNAAGPAARPQEQHMVGG